MFEQGHLGYHNKIIHGSIKKCLKYNQRGKFQHTDNLDSKVHE